MIVACNNEITEVHYSGYTIDKIYTCGGEVVYEKEPSPHDYSGDYFTMTSSESFRVIYSGTGYVSFSTNGGSTWTNLYPNAYWRFDDHNNTVLWKKTLQQGENSVGRLIVDTDVYYESANTMTVYGNILSMIYGDNFSGQTSFTGASMYNSFLSGYTMLVNAENLVLPATTIPFGAYQGMFVGCTRLEKSPKILPSTTLAGYCYQNMFNGCTSLITSPELPATTLASGCYRGMFAGCTSLDNIKCLATDVSASECTDFWVNNVAANGTFTKAASMNDWTTGVNGIPSGWTIDDAT